MTRKTITTKTLAACTTKAGTEHLHVASLTRWHSPYRSRPEYTVAVVVDSVAVRGETFGTLRAAREFLASL